MFTTRPDTLYGATYMVVAPEHPLLASLTTPEQQAAVEEYVQAASSKSDLERTELQKSKTGVFTGGQSCAFKLCVAPGPVVGFSCGISAAGAAVLVAEIHTHLHSSRRHCIFDLHFSSLNPGRPGS